MRTSVIELCDDMQISFDQYGSVGIGMIRRHPGVWAIVRVGVPPVGFFEWHKARMMPFRMEHFWDGDYDFSYLTTLAIGDDLAMEWRMRWS